MLVSLKLVSSKSEIGKLDLIVFGDQNVLRLNVPMSNLNNSMN
jgi:hypothetical protein